MNIYCFDWNFHLHYDATANTPLKIYYVSSIKTILCLHYNGAVCHSVLKAMLHGAIFLATCNAILPLRDVN